MKKTILICFMLTITVSTLIICMYQNEEQEKEQKLIIEFGDHYQGVDKRHEIALELAKLYENSKRFSKAMMWYDIAIKVCEWKGVALAKELHKEINEKIVALNKELLKEVSKALEPSRALLKNNLKQAQELLITLYSNTGLLGEARVSAALELAKIYEKQKKEKDSLIWYGNACKIKLDYFYSPQQEAINMLRNKGRELLAEGKFDEAIKIYGYGEQSTKANVPSLRVYRGDFEELGDVELFGKFGKDIEVIKKLKSSPIDSKLFIEAIKLKNEGNYEVAREKFNFLLDKRFTIVIPFLDAMPHREKSKLLVKEWLQLMPMANGQWDLENFRIENGWLEVKKEAEVYSLGTLEELIQDQFEEELPCLITIVKVHDGKYIIFDTTALGEHILTAEGRYIKNVGYVMEAFTFAMNFNDTKFDLINKITEYRQLSDFFNSFLDRIIRSVIDTENTGIYADKSEYRYKNIVSFQPKKSLTISGEAQFEVAEMFEKAANSLFGDEKKDKLGIAYAWYKHAYDLLPQGNFKEKALNNLNEVSQKIDELAVILAEPKKPIIIEKPTQLENNDLHKSLMLLGQALRNLYRSLFF